MSPRRRRMYRGEMWASLALSVASGAVWLLSGPYWFGGQYGGIPRHIVLLATGGTLIAGFGTDSGAFPFAPRGGIYAVQSHVFVWRGDWDAFMGWDALGVIVPLWFISVLFLIAAAHCYYLSRRPIPGLCPRCGYDLVKIPAGVCPECGKVPA